MDTRAYGRGAPAAAEGSLTLSCALGLLTGRGAAISAVAVASGASVGALVGVTGSPLGALVPLALGTLISMFAAPQIATLAFLFLLYINAPVVLVNFHGFPFIMGAAFIGLLAIPIGFTILRRESLVLPPGIMLVGLYVCVMAMSALVARHFQPAWETLLVHVGEGLLLVVLLVNLIRTRAMLRRAIWAVVLAGLFMGALSIHQEITGSYDDSYGGFAQVIGRGFSPDGRQLGERVLRPRLAGPIHEQNRYGQLMLVVVPLAVAAMLNERSRSLKVVAAVATVSSLAAVALTFSRGAFLGLGALVVAVLLFRLMRLRHAVPLLAMAVFLVIVFAPDFVARLGSLPEAAETIAEGGETGDVSILGRLTLNLAAVEMFLDYPLLGVGIGNFVQLSVDYANPLGMRHISLPFFAHNLYLEVAAETGGLGLAAFFTLLGYVLIQLWRRRTEGIALSRPGDTRTATALMFGLLAYLATAVFLHMAYERYFWVLIALCIAGTRVLTGHPDDLRLATRRKVA